MRNSYKSRRNFKEQWLTRRNKYKREKFGHIVGEVEEDNQLDICIANAFDALSQDVQEKVNY